MAVAELASVDGEVCPTPDARIPPGDDGLLRGDGVFEVVRLYEGRPFALGEHLDRMERSAAAIELAIERPALEAEIEALLERFGDEEGQLRLVVTRAGRRLAFTEPLPPLGESIALASVTYSPSVILTGVKSLSYAANMEATRLAKAQGAEEALLVRPDGVALEAPTSTIFWASADGELRTPSIETGILASITRDRILAELDAVEGEFRLEEILSAGEAFLASTTREVQAISRVDERDMPACPGPRTEEAAAAFTAVLERELERPAAA